jgi:hypothetical protein
LDNEVRADRLAESLKLGDRVGLGEGLEDSTELTITVIDSDSWPDVKVICVELKSSVSEFTMLGTAVGRSRIVTETTCVSV